MQIRLAGAADLAMIGEITVAAYGAFTLGPDDPYLGKLRNSAARAAEAELWLAEEDGAILGSVTICPIGSSWREIARDDEGEFRMLAVSPGARGRGIGESLVRHAVNTFAATGIDAMVLSTLPDMTDAHRLYQRLGFRPAPDRDWSPVPGVRLLAYQMSP